MYNVEPDRCVSISVWSLAASVAWAFAVGMVLWGVLYENDDSTQVGLAFSAAAATLSIRGFCLRLGRSIQSAFELGRDMGRAEVTPEVRPLR